MKCGIYWSRCLCKTIIFISNTYARIFSVSLLSLLIMLASSSLSPPTPPTPGGCVWCEWILRRTCQGNSARFYHIESRAGVTKDPTTQITQWSVPKIHMSLLCWIETIMVNMTLSPRLSLLRERFRKILSFPLCLTWYCFPWFGACPLEQLLPRFPLKAHNPTTWRKKANPSPAFPLPLILGAHPKGTASQWGGHLQQTAANSGLPWDPAQNP